jgi:hypothetical protein
MAGSLDRRDAEDPWGGHQPKYERLVMQDPNRFAITARAPSGERVDAPLGPFTFDGFVDTPSDRAPGE